MNNYLTYGDVLPEQVPGMHWPVVGNTRSQGIIAHNHVKFYLELNDLVDGITEKRVDVVGFRRACIECQGEYTPANWICDETRETVHTGNRVVFRTELFKVEL